jgi:hypothetical protein
MTVTISTFALLMVIIVIHTILEHLTNWVFRLIIPDYIDDPIIPFTIILATLTRWVFTISIIEEILL